jgi:hypothetical protein
MNLKTIFNNIINELSEDNLTYIEMYHGGNKWYSEPELRPPSKGRYEFGPGIYFTNNYETAKKYAKGSNVVQLVKIDKNFRDMKLVSIEIDNVLDFIKSKIPPKNRKSIQTDIIRYMERSGKMSVPLTVINNLIVNWESGSGQIGVDIANFFAQSGADAIVEDRSGNEQWMVVFNPKIIKKYEVVKNVPVENYQLPRVK